MLFKKYCLDVPSDVIFKSKSLYFIVGEEKGQNKNSIEEKKENIKKEEHKQLVEEFEGIQLSQSEDEVAFEEVRVQIKERIIQVTGHLFLYDCLKDKNLLVA